MLLLGWVLVLVRYRLFIGDLYWVQLGVGWLLVICQEQELKCRILVLIMVLLWCLMFSGVIYEKLRMLLLFMLVVSLCRLSRKVWVIFLLILFQCWVLFLRWQGQKVYMLSMCLFFGVWVLLQVFWVMQVMKLWCGMLYFRLWKVWVNFLGLECECFIQKKLFIVGLILQCGVLCSVICMLNGWKLLCLRVWMCCLKFLGNLQLGIMLGNICLVCRVEIMF